MHINTENLYDLSLGKNSLKGIKSGKNTLVFIFIIQIMSVWQIFLQFFVASYSSQDFTKKEVL